MQNFSRYLASMDGSLALLCLVGAIAFIFIAIVVGDFLRQRLKLRRVLRNQPASANSPLVTTFTNLFFKPWRIAKAPARRRQK